MIVALRLLKRSAKISSFSPIYYDIKDKCTRYLKKLTQFIHDSGHSQFFHDTEHQLVAVRYLLPSFKSFHVGYYSANGQNSLLPLIKFFERKIDSFETSPMEFGRNHFSSLRKIVWRRSKKSHKNINQITSGALVNAETVQLNLSSDVDSGNMISYRDVVVNANMPTSQGRNLRKFITDVRQDVLTPYGKWIKDGWLDERAKRGIFIKVVSYNILAQSLLETHPYLYRNCDEQHLNWGYRSFVLISELNRYDADILCLQEVEAEKLNFFNTQLGEFGYRGIFKKRTNEKDDGCAIYYKADKFDVRECVSVEYYQPTVNLLNRDNIGIVLRLSPKGNRNQCFVVATTHLLFNPKRNDIRLAQMQILLAEIDRIAFKSTNECNEPSYYPVILTGDFNLQPNSLVYDLLVSGTVNKNNSLFQNPMFSNRPYKKQLIPIWLGITDNCQHYYVTENRLTSRTEVSDFQHVKLFNTDRRSLNPNVNWKPNSPVDRNKFISDSLHHNLNLASVYSHADACARDATTFHEGWCTVDYIFYGPMQKDENVKGKKTDGELKLVSYLRLPDCDQATCLGPLPNEVCPSDHLPLAATFHLPVDLKNKFDRCSY